MRIAVASGKGGTGKTTVSVSLALTASEPVCLLDCDVEEPNCHLFIHPEISRVTSVALLVPQVDESKCTACGECGQFCQFNAIVSFKTVPLVFPELCHGCGGCMKVCPERAIREIEREIGVVEEGNSPGVAFVQGRLNVGAPLAPPLIREVKARAGSEALTIIDCPAGTSCTMLESVRGCDFALLVTEPTPFGLRDLSLAVEAIQELRVPLGVVVNRVGIGDDRVHDYCASEGIPVLLEIGDDRRIAEAYSRGRPVIEAVPQMRPALDTLLQEVVERSAVSPCEA
jgi:MinD superfamily P-loop ATPase